MRIGPLEIIVIIVIIIAVAIVARAVRFNRDNTNQNARASTDISVRQVKHKQANMWAYVKRIGITFVITGIILALAGMSMFRWAVQGYMWAFIIMVLGIGLVFLSRKK